MLDNEPFSLNGNGGSLLRYRKMQLQNTFWAIRPCRESKTCWTPEPFALRQNHSSCVLSERGPELKVFWSRRWRDGRRVGGHMLAKNNACGNRTVGQKTEPEGAEAGAFQSAPFGSKVGEPNHHSKRR